MIWYTYTLPEQLSSVNYLQVITVSIGKINFIDELHNSELYENYYYMFRYRV